MFDAEDHKKMELEIWKEHSRMARDEEAKKAEALAVSKENKAILMGLSKLLLDAYYANFITNYCKIVSVSNSGKFMDKETGEYDRILQDYVEGSVHEADRDTVLKMGSRSYASGHLNMENPSYSCVYRRLCGNHRYRWQRMNLILSSVREDGALENVVIAFMDVDNEKRWEEAYQRKLEENNENLARALVQENRYKEELKEAYDAVVKANHAKSEFLSNMSHDMRTPMNGIIGMATVAEDSLDEPEKVRDCMKKIERISKYLLEFLNNLLEMSRIESKDTTIAEEEVVLSDIVKSFALIVQQKVRDRHHKFTIHVHDIRHEHLKGDNLHLNQIFINIIGNAIKYTPEGGEISMDVTEREGADSKIGKFYFVISDNGVGMSKEFMPHLFEMFTQERSNARTDARGAGLGMAITNNLVEMMGGTLDVKSEVGKGSVFTVCLPLKISERYKPRETVSAYVIHVDEDIDRWMDDGDETPETSMAESLEGYRFLVVEDNEINMEIISEVLRQKEALVECAANGQIAYDMFMESEPGYYDLILMDIRMPVMNGYDATRMIRCSDHVNAAGIPIIALSADAFPEDIQKGRDAGMDAHVAKPIDFVKLFHEVERFLR